MSSPTDSPDAYDPGAPALAAALREVFGKMKRRLREQSGADELSWTQIAVLGRLNREGPVTVTALARAEGVRPQSMGQTVSGLEALGLLQGAPDPSDGRQTLLSLTPKCLQLIEASRAARQDWLLRAIQAELSPAEQDELTRAIPLLRRLVDS